MSGPANLSRRFEELGEQLRAVLATKHYVKGSYISGDFVDKELFINWVAKTKNLLSKACGEDSVHFREFVSHSTYSSYDTNHDVLIRLKAVFDAAQEDFDGGYCASVRSLIQAQVFDSELDQARALLSSGYSSAAAVIAGVVLETTLRQLCDDCGLPHSKLDKMNADLTKVGHYTVLKQKQITALADIRNNAAHGKPENYTADDVSDMIAKVEQFVSEQLN